MNAQPVLWTPSSSLIAVVWISECALFATLFLVCFLLSLPFYLIPFLVGFPVLVLFSGFIAAAGARCVFAMLSGTGLVPAGFPTDEAARAVGRWWSVWFIGLVGLLLLGTWALPILVIAMAPIVLITGTALATYSALHSGFALREGGAVAALRSTETDHGAKEVGQNEVKRDGWRPALSVVVKVWFGGFVAATGVLAAWAVLLGSAWSSLFPLVALSALPRITTDSRYGQSWRDAGW